MDRFICQLNIDHFRDLLSSVTDAARRHTIQQLLVQEEAHLRQQHPPRRDETPH